MEPRSEVTRGQQPPRDKAKMARANRRTALVFGAIAFGIYSWFILSHVMRASGASG